MVNKINYVFFGSSLFSAFVLDEFEEAGYLPSVIVTLPDKPQGRKMKLTPTVVKTWAIEKNIPVLDPVKLDSTFLETLKEKEANAQVFIVASYGKIIPRSVFDMPPHKTLNVHPSLLPKYRGASPLQFAILDDAKDTGVSIMKIDEEMDHGDIVAQREIHIDEWPTYELFEEKMARLGGKLLADILPQWVGGKIESKPQKHSEASYTKKIEKENAELDMTSDPYVNFRKIQAYHDWPQAYFFIVKNGKKLRVKVTSASFKDNKLTIEKVIPEGGKEMNYKDLVNGYFKNVQA